MGNPGYIYALINPALEGLVKVGKTTTNPDKRANELSSVTGVPMQFMVAHSVLVADCDLAEKYAHGLLEKSGYRVSSNREFFQAPLPVIMEAIRKTTDFVGCITEDEFNGAATQAQWDSLNKQMDELNALVSEMSTEADEENDMFEADQYYWHTPMCDFDIRKSIALYMAVTDKGYARAFYMLGAAYMNLAERLADEIKKQGVFEKLFGGNNKNQERQMAISGALDAFGSAMQKGYDFAYAGLAKYYAVKNNNAEAKKYWDRFFATESYRCNSDRYDYMTGISTDYHHFLYLNLNLDLDEANFQTKLKFGD